MSLTTLILRELRHRSRSLLLGILLVALVTALGLGMRSALRDFDAATAAEIAVLDSDTDRLMAELEDSMRKTMKGLGFNIHLYAEEQSLNVVHAQGFAEATMPEEFVDRLAESRLMTVNHLLPSLTRRLAWEEYRDRLAHDILVIGIRGEVPLSHKAQKRPLLDPVEEGTIVLGAGLGRVLGKEVGEEVSLLGQTLRIAKIHPERGGSDDITVWMHLAGLQGALDLQGRVSEIKALECNCASLDRLGEIRGEIAAILPGVQVIEKESQALARAEARLEAQRVATQQRESVLRARGELREGRSRFAERVLPLLILLATAVLGYLALANVRDRRAEIALLRSLGLPTRSVMLAVLVRAGIVGLVGALVGVLVASLLASPPPPSEAAFAILLAGAFSLAAGWLPALSITRTEPASVLRGES